MFMATADQNRAYNTLLLIAILFGTLLLLGFFTSLVGSHTGEIAGALVDRI